MSGSFESVRDSSVLTTDCVILSQYTIACVPFLIKPSACFVIYSNCDDNNISNSSNNNDDDNNYCGFCVVINSYMQLKSKRAHINPTLVYKRQQSTITHKKRN